MPTKLIGLFIMAAAVSGVLISACNVNNRPHLVSMGSGVDAPNRQGLRGALPPPHNLQLIFQLKPRDNHIAAVDVMLVEEKGRVMLHARADSQRFYANLPPGKYYVRASANGHDVEKTVKVEGTSTTVSLNWPATDRKNPA